MLSEETIKYIPDNMLRIDKAKMFYYKLPKTMFNKSQPRTYNINTPRTYNINTPRTIFVINLLGIVKEVNGGDLIFYECWDPKIRGELIKNEFYCD